MYSERVNIYEIGSAMTAITNTRQNRRLQRLAEQGVRQTNVLVHDVNRDSLEALRPHLASPTSKDALSRLTTALAAQQPVNVSQVRQISPFRYPGGKTWLVPVAREWLASLGRPSVLLEPFAGGGVIGLTAAAERLVDHVVMVELDDDVAAVWKILVSGSDRDVKILSNKVLRFDVTHENVRVIIDGTPNRTVDMAFRTIVKNRCQRGGIMAPGAGLTKEGENGKGLSSRWYAETLVSRFATIRSFRDRITFEQGDALAHAAAAVGAQHQVRRRRRFGDVAAQPLDPRPGNLCVLGDHRLQHAGPHFDGFLDEIIQPPHLQRCEAVDEIGVRRLRPGLLDRFQFDALLRLGRHARQPLAVAAVEDEQFRAFAHAQNVGEVVALLRIGHDPRAGGEVAGHMEPLHLVVGAHAGVMRQWSGAVKSPTPIRYCRHSCAKPAETLRAVQPQLSAA